MRSGTLMTMDIQTACGEIERCMDSMEERYGRPVFDEWALVELTGSTSKIFHYHGPRADGFEASLARDLRHLRHHLESERMTPGDFEFARDAGGTGFDALIVVGEDLYLLCNHTQNDFATLAEDPLWRKAQLPFVDLTEAIRAQPVIISSEVSA